MPAPTGHDTPDARVETHTDGHYVTPQWMTLAARAELVRHREAMAGLLSRMDRAITVALEDDCALLLDQAGREGGE